MFGIFKKIIFHTLKKNIICSVVFSALLSILLINIKEIIIVDTFITRLIIFLVSFSVFWILKYIFIASPGWTDDSYFLKIKDEKNIEYGRAFWKDSCKIIEIFHYSGYRGDLQVSFSKNAGDEENTLARIDISANLKKEDDFDFKAFYRIYNTLGLKKKLCITSEILEKALRKQAEEKEEELISCLRKLKKGINSDKDNKKEIIKILISDDLAKMLSTVSIHRCTFSNLPITVKF